MVAILLALPRILTGTMPPSQVLRSRELRLSPPFSLTTSGSFRPTGFCSTNLARRPTSAVWRSKTNDPAQRVATPTETSKLRKARAETNHADKFRRNQSQEQRFRSVRDGPSREACEYRCARTSSDSGNNSRILYGAEIARTKPLRDDRHGESGLRRRKRVRAGGPDD